MKRLSRIAAIIDRPELLEDKVERLALRPFDKAYREQMVLQNWKALETSSTEAYLSGIIRFDGEKDHAGIPFITSFLFTCVRIKDKNYKMTWSVSLS